MGIVTRIGTCRRSTAVAACLAVFAILAVVLYLPTGPFDSTRMPDGGFWDPGQSVWNLGWTAFAVQHGASLFHTSLIDYPAGANLANDNFAPLLGLLAMPVTLLAGPIASLNFIMRLAMFASATSMFLVLRPRCKWVLPAFFGGLLYGFGPYLVSQSATDVHPSLAFSPLVPPILWCLYELIVVQRRSALRMGLLLGILTGAQAYISTEIIADIGVVVFVALVVGIALHRSFIREKARHLAVGLASAAAVFGVVAGDLLWFTLVAPGHLVGPVQSPSILAGDSNDLLSPVIPTSNVLLAPSSLAHLANSYLGGNRSENGGYLGLAILGAWAASAITLRRDRVVRTATGVAGIAFVLSLGPRLVVDGRNTGVPLPEALFSHLPLLDNVVAARFSLLVTVCACVALALGFDRALTVLRSRDGARRRWSFGIIGLAVVVLATVAPRPPLGSSSFGSTTLGWPGTLDKVVQAIPAGSVVLTYPFPVEPWTQPMVWQAQDHMAFSLVGGIAYVREPDGANGFSAPLLYPTYVQEFLAQEEFAGFQPAYPPPGDAVGPTGTKALCSFLDLQSVTAVLYWQAGRGALAVRTYFRRALGPPTLDDNRVLLWLRPSAGCH
jgi:hypothetical protein